MYHNHNNNEEILKKILDNITHIKELLEEIKTNMIYQQSKNDSILFLILIILILMPILL